jgi:hypothetical protein
VHFVNKNAILADILYEDIEAVTKETFATLPVTQPTIDQLMYIGRSLYAYYLQKIDLSRTLLQNNLFQPADVVDYGSQVNIFIEAITLLIEAGQTRGDVVATKDAKAMATAFMSCYFFVLMGLMRDEALDLEGGVTQLKQMALIIMM